MTIRAAFIAAVFALAVLATAPSTHAAVVFYSDWTAFNTAGGNVLSFDSFEDDPGPAQTIVRSEYSMSENGSGTALVLDAIDSSLLIPNGLSNANTDGAFAIIYGNSGGSILTFQFDNPINGFGFDFTSTIDVPTVNVGGDVSTTFATTANTPSFFGVIDTTGTFQTLTFNTAGTPANVAYDSVSFGIIPEPSTAVLFVLAAFMFRLGRRRVDAFS